MPLFLVKRLGAFAATLLVASALVFAMLELLPGNAAQVILGDGATPEAIAALTQKLGLDRPAPARYPQWIAGLLQGRSAHSAAYDTPSLDLIAERLPLALIAMALTTVIVAGAGCLRSLAPSAPRRCRRDGGEPARHRDPELLAGDPAGDEGGAWIRMVAATPARSRRA